MKIEVRNMHDLYYTKNGVRYLVGDKVTGEFAEWDTSTCGTVRFGLFDACWPSGAHECAESYGFYIETECHKEGYSIVQIEGLVKIKQE